MAKRLIFVGDVHGCLQELQDLLKEVQFTEKDRLVLLGDLIDKGPLPAETVQFVRGLQEDHDVDSLMGNHEEKFLRWVSHAERGVSTNPVRDSTGRYQRLYNELDSDAVEWLRQRPYFLEERGYTAVHAGVPSGLRNLLTMEEQQLWGEQIASMKGVPLKVSRQLLADFKHYRDKFKMLLRLRFVTPSGKMVSLGKDTPDDIFWTERYNGRFNTVVYGHEANVGGPVVSKHAIGIDTGCCMGGNLTALVVQERKRSFVSVPAHKVYVPQPLID